MSTGVAAPSLRAIVDDKNVRIFAAGIAFLAKSGKEIMFEATNEALILRTLNDARSVCASVTFKREFFAGELGVGGASGSIKCKLAAKAMLQAFHTLKNVQRLQLYFTATEGGAHYLIVHFGCKHDVTRSHSLFYEDGEVVSAIFDRDVAQHHIIARPAMLVKLVDQLRGTDEMTLVATQAKVAVQSHHDSSSTDASTFQSAVRTMLSMPSNELDFYQLDRNGDHARKLLSEEAAALSPIDRELVVDVTFTMREFRAMLAFAEDRHVGSDEVALFFNDHGAPFMASTEGVNSRPFTADVVVATIETSALTEEQRREHAMAALQAARAGSGSTGLSALPSTFSSRPRPSAPQGGAGAGARPGPFVAAAVSTTPADSARYSADGIIGMDDGGGGGGGGGWPRTSAAAAAMDATDLPPPPPYFSVGQTDTAASASALMGGGGGRRGGGVIASTHTSNYSDGVLAGQRGSGPRAPGATSASAGISMGNTADGSGGGGGVHSTAPLPSASAPQRANISMYGEGEDGGGGGGGAGDYSGMLSGSPIATAGTRAVAASAAAAAAAGGLRPFVDGISPVPPLTVAGKKRPRSSLGGTGTAPATGDVPRHGFDARMHGGDTGDIDPADVDALFGVDGDDDGAGAGGSLAHRGPGVSMYDDSDRSSAALPQAPQAQRRRMDEMPGSGAKTAPASGGGSGKRGLAAATGGTSPALAARSAMTYMPPPQQYGNLTQDGTQASR